jgi:hypothetical protein
MRTNMKLAKWSIGLLICIGTASAAQPNMQIPAKAVKTEDGSYRYTDKKTGKKWLYRRTPFGVARLEDKPVAAAELPSDMTASEDGDTVRFERPGPFGTYKWQRSKTELNEMEQAVLAREKTRAAARQD